MNAKIILTILIKVLQELPLCKTIHHIGVSNQALFFKMKFFYNIYYGYSLYSNLDKSIIEKNKK